MRTYFEHARGNSKLPGTDSTTMLLSLTPCAFKVAIVPETSASMTVLFHLEWTIAIRRAEPSNFAGAAAGPLMLLIVVVVVGEWRSKRP